MALRNAHIRIEELGDDLETLVHEKRQLEHRIETLEDEVYSIKRRLTTSSSSLSVGRQHENEAEADDDDDRDSSQYSSFEDSGVAAEPNNNPSVNSSNNAGDSETQSDADADGNSNSTTNTVRLLYGTNSDSRYEQSDTDSDSSSSSSSSTTSINDSTNSIGASRRTNSIRWKHRWLVKRTTDGIGRLGGRKNERIPQVGDRRDSITNRQQYELIQQVRQHKRVVCCNDDRESYMAPQFPGQMIAYIDDVPNAFVGEELIIFMNRSQNPPTKQTPAYGQKLGWEYCGNYKVCACGTSFRDPVSIPNKLKQQIVKQCMKPYQRWSRLSASHIIRQGLIKEDSNDLGISNQNERHKTVSYWHTLLSGPHHTAILLSSRYENIRDEADDLGYYNDMPIEDLYSNVIVNLKEFYPLTTIKYVEYNETIYNFVTEDERGHSNVKGRDVRGGDVPRFKAS